MNPSIDFHLSNVILNNNEQDTFTFKKNSIEFQISYDNFKLEISPTTSVSNVPEETILSILKEFSYPLLASLYMNFFQNIYFFPAERTALNLVAKIIVKEQASLVNEVTQRTLQGEDYEDVMKSISHKFRSHYPLAIDEYIKFVNDLDEIEQQDSIYVAFADEIESTLLKGKVFTSEYGDVEFQPNASNQSLEVHISSSLVKSLSSLVFYFRHVAKKHDVIMIDEPELNLHPNNQRLLARILAKATTSGINIILSTHSDYILKEFNNLIMLGNDAPEEIKKGLFEDYGYKVEEALNRENMSIYFFNNHTIQELNISESGVGIETIDETIEDLDNTTEHIYFRLFETVR